METTMDYQTAKARYEELNTVSVAMGHQFAAADDAGKAALRPELDAQDAAVKAAYGAVLDMEQDAARELGYAISGALATCAVCGRQFHVSDAPRHQCCAHCKRDISGTVSQRTASGHGLHPTCVGRWAQTEQRSTLVTTAQAYGYRVLAARFAGVCAGCGARFAAGAEIAWQQRDARHLGCLGVVAERGERTCRYCGDSESGSFGGLLCPMSEGGEQPHRWE